MNDERTFLQKLKVGDRVIVTRSRGGIADGRIRSVVKITPTQIVLDLNDRFNRSTGWRIGSIGGLIDRIASANDLEREDRQRKEREQRKAEMAQAENFRQELIALFPKHARPSISNGSASTKDKSTFDVEFHSLTESEVRDLAEKLMFAGDR